MTNSFAERNSKIESGKSKTEEGAALHGAVQGGQLIEGSVHMLWHLD
jgi:hypothetical protein